MKVLTQTGDISLIERAPDGGHFYVNCWSILIGDGGHAIEAQFGACLHYDSASTWIKVFAVIMIGPGSDRSGDCLPLVGIGLAEFYRRAWSVSQHPRPASVVLYCEVEAMNRDCVRLFVVGIVVAEVNPNGVADFPTKDWSGNACIGSDI